MPALDNSYVEETREKTMSSVHQFVSASLVAVFGAMLFIASHIFSDYRSAKKPSFQKTMGHSLSQEFR
jgi:hypothetical protein